MAYVEAWIGALKKDPREIIRAASAARKLSDLALGLSRARPAGPRLEARPVRPSPMLERLRAGGPER